MQLIRHLSSATPVSRAVAIGNFDGLHVGHQSVIAAMRRAAEANDLVPSVLTFEPHPRLFFAPTAPVFRLETLPTKLRRLSTSGVEHVVMPRFNAGFANLTADAFLEDVLQKTLNVRAVVVGDNFAFGKNRGGDVAMLRAWGAANSIEVVVVPPVMVDGAPCSSSAVRAAIGAGDMKMAASLLGRPYQFTGRVMHGDGRGRTIGFATANLALPQRLKLPAYGVYAVRATVHGTTHDAVANVGVRPTVANVARPSLEVHMFDFNQTIYGASMQVQFIEKIRDEKKFHSLDALTSQIADDCAAARFIFSGGSPWKATH